MSFSFQTPQQPASSFTPSFTLAAQPSSSSASVPTSVPAATPTFSFGGNATAPPAANVAPSFVATSSSSLSSSSATQNPNQPSTFTTTATAPTFTAPLSSAQVRAPARDLNTSSNLSTVGTSSFFAGIGTKPTTGTATLTGGSSASTSSGALAGSLPLSQTTTNQNQSNPIIGKTKFVELPKQIQDEITKLEQHINEQILLSDFISTQRTQEFVEKIENEVNELSQNLSTLSTFLLKDSTQIEQLRKIVHSELQNAEIATRIVDFLKSGFKSSVTLSSETGINGVGMYGNTAWYYSVNEYFWNVVNSLEHRMEQYRQMIEDLERTIPTLTSRQPSSHTPASLNNIMRNQYESFLVLASNLAKIHDSVKELKMNWETLTGKTAGKRTNIEDTLSLARQAQIYLAPNISANSAAARPFGQSFNNPLQQSTSSTFGSSTFGLNKHSTNVTTSSTFGNIGASASTPTPGFSFGSTPSSQTQQQQQPSSTTGFGGFGTQIQQQQQQNKGFSFGGSANTLSTGTGFGLGGTSSTNTGSGTTGFGFGTASSKPISTPSIGTGFSFGMTK